MGRKKANVDNKMVMKLASVGCTWPEIAEITGWSESTLQRHAQEEYNKGKSALNMSIRRKQVDLMNNGSTTMAIWLGKQYLGQTDKTEVDTKGEFTLGNPAWIEMQRKMLAVLDTIPEAKQKVLAVLTNDDESK